MGTEYHVNDEFAIQNHFLSVITGWDQSVVTTGEIAHLDRGNPNDGLVMNFANANPGGVNPGEDDHNLGYYNVKPPEHELWVLIEDSTRFIMRAIDVDGNELSYKWIFEGDTISTDTTIIATWNEFGNFDIRNLAFDEDHNILNFWQIHVLEFFIDSYYPVGDQDNPHLVVKRDSMVNFELEIAHINDVDYEFVWTHTDRNGQENMVSDSNSSSVYFVQPGDHLLEGRVFDENHDFSITWSIDVRSVIWNWWPFERVIHGPLDSFCSFRIDPVRHDSDSLVYIWKIDSEPLELDEDVNEFDLVFNEIGLGEHILEGILRDGCNADTITWEINVRPPNQISKQEQNLFPLKFSLVPPSPNPFNNMTKISYTIPQNSHINLSVFDISGRLVRTLISEQTDAGHYFRVFNAENLTNGVYFVRLDNENQFAVQKVILMK
jgi:hypothetical protein